MTPEDKKQWANVPHYVAGSRVMNPNTHDLSDKGFLPDEATAIAVAKAVLRPLVGKDCVDGAKALTYYATLAAAPADYRYVENAPPARLRSFFMAPRVGDDEAKSAMLRTTNVLFSPVIRVEIDRKSGRVLNGNQLLSLTSLK